MTRARDLARFANNQALSVDSDLEVGINSTSPAAKLDVRGNVVITGVLTATTFVGDGSNLTGVSGFATALNSSQSSPLFNVFKTPRRFDVGAGTSITVESDATSGNVAFMRNAEVHVAVGSTFHIGSGTTLVTNVLSIF
tara:strand:- start:319 stop:735 length:417 start_codon:yes stop_codon:yes gene_type:complete